VSGVVAIDDDSAIADLAVVDGVADTVGGETAAKLFGRVRDGGHFGYASVVPDARKSENLPMTSVMGNSFCRSVAGCRDASEAHALAQRGGSARIIPVCLHHETSAA
jgi:NADPH:quinone reductase-like Zn-dependent oxidoreductase